jgi:hypothetical protein
MNSIKKHSKYKNTGILFELLVRQITSDMMTNKESKAVDILKKYYTNTELSKEFTLYSTLLNSPKINESRANTLISTIIEEGKKLDHDKLNKEKFNLIKEIRKCYEVDNFFNAKVNNYKLSAAIYTLLEANYSKLFISPKQLVTNKMTILEHVTQDLQDEKKLERKVVEEFMREDKDVRTLAFRILVEKFNERYIELSDEQKDVLREYINNISDTVELKKYLNNKLEEVKTELTNLKSKVKDKVVTIKLNEVVSLIKPIEMKQSIKDDHLVSIMQYIELVKEIKATL